MFVAPRTCSTVRRVLRPYSHPCSPKTFTQPQLFACLVLKEALRLDYRGAAAVLNDSPSWQAAIERRRAPHFTTLQKAAQRLLRARRAERLLGQTIRLAQQRKLLDGRPSTKPPRGRWRRLMRQRFRKRTYGQRWQVETAISVIK